MEASRLAAQMEAMPPRSRSVAAPTGRDAPADTPDIWLRRGPDAPWRGGQRPRCVILRSSWPRATPGLGGLRPGLRPGLKGVGSGSVPLPTMSGLKGAPATAAADATDANERWAPSAPGSAAGGAAPRMRDAVSVSSASTCSCGRRAVRGRVSAFADVGVA
eukprot:6164993-Prymnesium_polylepis.1